MAYAINQIPIFEELKDSKNILLAGAGGGFDVYSGIPLLFNLRKQGKKVVLGNLSFTWLNKTSSECVFPHCYQIKNGDQDLIGLNYFPEKHLKNWLTLQGELVDIYAFEKAGINPLKDIYKYLIETHEIDTVVLVDGGTDSLMFGDEGGLGTPYEDFCSMAAVYRSGIKKQFLVNVGFGVDHYHGVSHFRFLENVAELSKEGGYLGLFQITQEMEEAKKYRDAIAYVNERMKGNESIVSNSIISALEGEYGNYHRTTRTSGSKLWINPLMTIYWSFDLRKVIRKIKYYEELKNVNSIGEFSRKLVHFRSGLDQIRKNKQMPI